MMKNLLVLTLVLAMASVASAGLVISVNGVVDPPDSEVYALPSDILILDIHGTDDPPDQGTPPNPGNPGAGVVIGVLVGPGTITQDAGTVNLANPGIIMDVPGFGGMATAIFFDLAKPDPEFRLLGLVADGIVFHCEDIGEVEILLMDLDTGEVYDTQIIHQTPEPITMALLGLGGLFLRRRK
jgi:hypothetical protein